MGRAGYWAVAAGLLAALFPAPALAQFECLSSQLRETERQRLVQAFDSRDFEAMNPVFPAERLKQILEGCQKREIDAFDDAEMREALILSEAFPAVMRAMVFKLSSEGVLISRHGVPRASLDRAWYGLSAAQRAELSRESLEERFEALMAFVRATRPDVTRKQVDALRQAQEITAEQEALDRLLQDFDVYSNARAVLESAVRG